MRRAYADVGHPLSLTTLVLGAGFCVLTASEFLPIAHLGAETALTLAIALLCDLYVLPSLLTLSGALPRLAESARNSAKQGSGASNLVYQDRRRSVG